MSKGKCLKAHYDYQRHSCSASDARAHARICHTFLVNQVNTANKGPSILTLKILVTVATLQQARDKRQEGRGKKEQRDPNMENLSRLLQVTTCKG